MTRVCQECRGAQPVLLEAQGSGSPPLPCQLPRSSVLRSNCAIQKEEEMHQIKSEAAKKIKKTPALELWLNCKNQRL